MTKVQLETLNPNGMNENNLKQNFNDSLQDMKLFE